MNLEGKVVIITGAAKGIGAALATSCLQAGVSGLLIADQDAAAIHSRQTELNRDNPRVLAQVCDVRHCVEVEALVATAIENWGRVDVFFSNAGVMQSGDIHADSAQWQFAWDVNVMGHVNCAQAVIPSLLRQGGGYFVLTASAAGLLTALGAAPYAVTKHASVALAEWLSITYGKEGVVVSALCPAAVDTEMLAAAASGNTASAVKSGGTVISPEQVARITLQAMQEERFLILTHPEVQTFSDRKHSDLDGWLKGMGKFA